MEFWGVEVKSGQSVSVEPKNKVVHLSQVCLDDVKKAKGSNPISLFVKTGNHKLVLGILSAEKFPQLPLDIFFGEKFELSHNWKNGSVHFIGYKFLSKGDNSDSEEDVALTVVDNGKPVISGKPKVSTEDAKKAIKSEQKEASSDDDEFEVPKAIFSIEDDEGLVEPVNIACPSKTVQFANHMILGSQMELSEIEALPKKVLREEAGRAFRLQAPASMDMWLCMKQAINAVERAKKAYDDGRSKVAEAGKALQDHANLVKDMQAAERLIKAYEAKLAEMVAALEAAQLAARDAEEAKEAVQVALEESERAKAAEIEAAVQEAIRSYRTSPEFSNMMDEEVVSEMAGLVYRFKRYNPGRKLNLNFIADPPPLPEGMTEEDIEDYEGGCPRKGPSCRGP